MVDKSETTALKPGTLYRVVWPDHYNYHQRTHGYTGKFVRMRERHCSLHGNFLGMEAEFIKVKPSGKLGSTFASPLDIIKITEVQNV